MVWLTSDSEEFWAVQELEEASDRSAAIIAAAIIDSQLNDAMRKELHGDESPYSARVRDRVFDTDKGGCLGGFAPRIHVAYLLGFLSADAHADLLNIASIRNRFAHFAEDWTFDSQRIKAKCANFRLINSRVQQVSPRTGYSLLVHAGDEGVKVSLGSFDPEAILKSPKERFLGTAKLFCAAFYYIRRNEPLPDGSPFKRTIL